MKKGMILAIALLLLSLCGCKAAMKTGEIWVMDVQMIYSADGALLQECQIEYDEDGYQIYQFRKRYYSDGSVSESTLIFEYAGEELPNGKRSFYEIVESGGNEISRRENPSYLPRGRGRFLSSFENICTCPYHPEEMDEATILFNWNDRTDNYPQFEYAEYTFDEHGNPIRIVTYGEDLSVIGTCEMTWRKMDLFE